MNTEKKPGFFFGVEVARRVRVPMTDAVIRGIIAYVITANASRSRNGSAISVAFVGPTAIRRLNRTYHGEDRVTDVLAFGQPETGDWKLGIGVRHWLGEIVVCPAYVRQQARRAGEPLARELTRVLVHGTLHLFGYDHATPKQAEAMFGVQEQIVKTLKSKL